MSLFWQLIGISLIFYVVEAIFTYRYKDQKPIFNKEFKSLAFSTQFLVGLFSIILSAFGKICSFTAFVLMANLILKKFGL